MNYFLITGLAKSGTTWVQRLCRAHPEMYCRAEDQFTKIWPRISEVTTDYNQLVELRDRERDQQGVDPLTTMDATQLFYAMIRITLDKAPEDRRWSGIKDLILSAHGFLRFLPQARVVNVIRDPRDVVISSLAHARRIDSDASETITGVGDRSLSDCCHHWMKQMELFEKAARGYPGRTHDIRYEDLIEDFSGTTRALFGFFGVDDSDRTLNALSRETDFKTLSGGRAPGEIDEKSYFRKGVAGDWRQTLSKAQIQLAKEICGPQLKERGYDPG